MDTLPGEDESRDQMLSIESKTYKVIMKDLVDSDEKNKVADFKIAKTIYTSFKVYEVNRKKFDVSYFKFK